MKILYINICQSAVPSNIGRRANGLKKSAKEKVGALKQKLARRYRFSQMSVQREIERNGISFSKEENDDMNAK